MCLNKKIAIKSLLLGLVITFVTGVFVNTNIIGEFPDIEITTEPWVRVSYRGYILPWIRQVVYPGAPQEIVLANLVMDIVIWTLIALAVLFLVFPKNFARPKKRKAKKRRKR